MIGEDRIVRLRNLAYCVKHYDSDSFAKRVNKVSEEVIQEVIDGKRDLDKNLIALYTSLAEKVEGHVHYAVLERKNWLNAKMAGC